MALEENPNKDMPSQLILKDLGAYHIAKHYIKFTTIEIRTMKILTRKKENTINNENIKNLIKKRNNNNMTL